MNNIKLSIAVLLIAFLTAGCQSSKSIAETTAPTTETTLQTQMHSAPEPSETEETTSGVDRYQAFQWMVNLKAEDVAYVEFLNFSDPQFPYRRYEGEEIQEVIDLFQAKKCREYMPFHPVYEYEPVVQWQGYFTREFHVVMKDGTAHTVGSVYSVSTVIDGTGFETISDWLNHHWPESGNAPLPENWEQEVASRKYHTAEVTSILSTTVHDSQRENLDYSYDTDIAFGAQSRHYPIGRGGIELSASGASQTGVTLSTYWTGTNGLTRLHVQPLYWMEKWQEDTGTYLPLEDGQFSSDTPPGISFRRYPPLVYFLGSASGTRALPGGNDLL